MRALGGGERFRWVHSWEGECPGSSVLRDFEGEDPNRIFISFPSASVRSGWRSLRMGRLQGRGHYSVWLL